jgi:hypothetical protein
MSIHAKINQVMQAVKGVEKTRTNKHGNFKYAGHEDVNEVLRGHFARLGIVRTAKMVDCAIIGEGTILAHCEISYTDIEDPGAPLVVPMWAVQPSQTSKGGVTAQQVGQALSYATKNVEFKLFALTGDNEADSDSTEAYNPNERAAQPPEENSLTNGAMARAGELLAAFTTARTLAEVGQVNDTFKAEWGTLKTVKGLAEQVASIRAAATKRIELQNGANGPA